MMVALIKDTLKKLPPVQFARTQVRWWREKNRAGELFENPKQYLDALKQKGNGTIDLRTRDGLRITIRQNLWDARIVKEIFFEKPYLRHLKLAPRPIIVDIGGYIGDFSIYCVKYLNPSKVVVYEPTAENYKMLKRNIELNGYEDRIIAVNKAVSNTHEVELNVQIDSNEEVHVSEYWYKGSELRKLPCATLPEIFETHGIEHIDLLKVDCEGGEYNILETAPEELFPRIRNLVFEFHRIEGWEPRLDQVLERLRSAGYTIHRDRMIISACRA